MKHRVLARWSGSRWPRRSPWVSTFHSAVRAHPPPGRVAAMGYPSSGSRSTTTADQTVRLTEATCCATSTLQTPSEFPPAVGAIATISRWPRTRASCDPTSTPTDAAPGHTSRSAYADVPTAEYQARAAQGRGRAWTSTTCSTSHRAACSDQAARGPGLTTRSAGSSYILVDEYQDTNPVAERAGSGQLAIRPPQHLAVVGDQDQSHLPVPGACATSCVTSSSSSEAFPDTTVIILEQNYRSTQTHPRRRQRAHRPTTMGRKAEGALDPEPGPGRRSSSATRRTATTRRPSGSHARWSHSWPAGAPPAPC